MLVIIIASGALLIYVNIFIGECHEFWSSGQVNAIVFKEDKVIEDFSVILKHYDTFSYLRHRT
jgi:hypothetical protein